MQVILFAPLYDSYIPIVERAGAKVVVLQLKAPDWHFDREGMAWRTRLMMFGWTFVFVQGNGAPRSNMHIAAKSVVMMILLAFTMQIALLVSNSPNHLNTAEVIAAFSPRTKLVVVNTPHNPTGKVGAIML